MGSMGDGFFDTATTGIDLSALAVARYTFNSGFLVIGKAGIAYLNQSDVGLSISGFGPKVALGIGYQFNPRWEMDLTAEATAARVFGAASNNDDGSANLTYSGGLFLGVTYTFA